MKRELYLVRDLLLFLEEKADESTYQVSNTDILDVFEKKGFSLAQVNYHLALVFDAGLIKGENPLPVGADGFWLVGRLTWKGHEYLDILRNDTLLKKLSAIGKELGVKSIETLMNVGFKVVETAAMEALRGQFRFPMG